MQLTSDQPDDDPHHLLHDAETGNRNFVWDENCYWWEVVTTPTAEGYYQSINPDYNGKYNYYYYDGSANCWKIKKITVTWNIEGSTTNYSVGYGTKPEWYGGTPSKTSSSSNYYYIWDGWIVPGSETPLANSELPEVTADITFTAHFYEKYYQSLVTFKNDDGTILESKLWNRGSIPSYEGTPTKGATASQTFEFNGNWSPAISAVGSSAVEYVAQYTATTRQYNVEFVNYDMSPLGSILVDYNATLTDATYKAAIAPSDFEPYKPDNSAYSFVFDGWRLNGASSNGFAQVKGDQTYVAQFAETTKKYKITFLDDDGETVLHWTQLEYGAMAAYDGPATSGFDKQDVAWNYTFAGWDPATFSEVQGPQTYTATYNRSARKYTITWLNWDGSPLKEPTITSTIDYGSAPGYSLVGNPAPTREASDGKTYEWDGWTTGAYGAGMFYSIDNLPDATGDATYYAHFRITAIDVASTSDISINEDTEVTTTTVHVNGRLAVSSTLTTDDLILEATPSSSGTISGIENITVNSNAYFDYKFDVDPWHWSAFGVPFEIDLDAAAPLKEKTSPLGIVGPDDYDIVYYDTEERAAHGASKNCWKYVDNETHRLIPGRLYMIAFDKHVGHVGVVRFKKATSAPVNCTTPVQLITTGPAGGNNNWNGIANPMMYHALLGAGVTECQVHDGGEIGKDGYYTYNMTDKKFFVGKAAFVQVPQNQDPVVVTPADGEDPLHAPRRTKASVATDNRYDIQIAPSNEAAEDRLLVLAEEDKADEYVIVSDLAKAGVSPVRAQMWVDRYSEKLCKNTTAFINNKADYPLVISTPKAGEYDLFINEQPDDETMLYLTYDGNAIWNLSYGGYVAHLEKGTTTHYGLRIVRTPKVSTGIEETTIQNGEAIRKVIVDDKVYIIRNGEIYSITGQKAQ